jgi:hypothetical protein
MPNPPLSPFTKGGSFLPLKKGGQEGFNQERRIAEHGEEGSD